MSKSRTTERIGILKNKYSEKMTAMIQRYHDAFFPQI